ncbi:hypothetical protein [Kitasatospora fiedleri]|uniref:hypothetical protein n=1 Tax=Kitasatospora fiedleri TaxID=2991545 RepID=UPI00249BB62C|nr:hypothetical protein [Kitasatospora fiedleri]
MAVTPPVRPVSPLLKALLLGPLALAAGWAFLVLWPAADATGDLFAWTTSPVTAVLLGSAHGGAAAMLALAVRARCWAEVRVATAAGCLLMLLMLATTLAGRRDLHPDGGPLLGFLAARGWLAVHLAAPPVGLAALVAQLRTPGPAPARTPGCPGGWPSRWPARAPCSPCSASSWCCAPTSSPRTGPGPPARSTCAPSAPGPSPSAPAWRRPPASATCAGSAAGWPPWCSPDCSG